MMCGLVKSQYSLFITPLTSPAPELGRASLQERDDGERAAHHGEHRRDKVIPTLRRPVRHLGDHRRDVEPEARRARVRRGVVVRQVRLVQQLVRREGLAALQLVPAGASSAAAASPYIRERSESPRRRRVGGRLPGRTRGAAASAGAVSPDEPAAPPRRRRYRDRPGRARRGSEKLPARAKKTWSARRGRSGGRPCRSRATRTFCCRGPARRLSGTGPAAPGARFCGRASAACQT